jgi:4-hydroxy-2-oxoheptanedioate aldolase
MTSFIRNGVTLRSDFRHRVLSREVVLGTFVNMPDEAVVEILAYSGLDFVIIDTEHSPIDRLRAENLVRAAETSGIAALIRVGAIAPSEIGRSLDTGALGIQVPLLMSASDAMVAVSGARYHPLGRRGMTMGRATRYGADELGPYLDDARDYALLSVQIETTEAMDAVTAIARTEGVDIVFVGPLDLSHALGQPGVFDDKFERVVASLVEKILEEDKIAGTAVGDGSEVAARVDQGFTFITIGSDLSFLSYGTRNAVLAARAAAESDIVPR